MNPFFLFMSIGFSIVIIPLGWHLFNLVKELGLEVQIMLAGVLILLTTSVIWKLSKRFEI